MICGQKHLADTALPEAISCNYKGGKGTSVFRISWTKIYPVS